MPPVDAPPQLEELKLSLFERYLTVWVALCIIAGVVLGHFLPGVFHTIGAAEIAKVNLPVAALIWLMIVPMLIKIDFGALGKVREHWRGIGVVATPVVVEGLFTQFGSRISTKTTAFC